MRLVDADAILNTFCDNCPNRAYCEDREQKCSAYSDTEEILKSAPAVEAKPIEYGRFEPYSEKEKYEVYKKYRRDFDGVCSECGSNMFESDKFCAECGAKMVGEE